MLATVRPTDQIHHQGTRHCTASVFLYLIQRNKQFFMRAINNSQAISQSSKHCKTSISTLVKQLKNKGGKQVFTIQQIKLQQNKKDQVSFELHQKCLFFPAGSLEKDTIFDASQISICTPYFVRAQIQPIQHILCKQRDKVVQIWIQAIMVIVNKIITMDIILRHYGNMGCRVFKRGSGGVTKL